MSKARPAHWTAIDYQRAAQEYLRNLPLEHFMEATPQAMQRKITLESLDLVHGQRPEVQVFNELLVQYFHRGQFRRVVPDNMVIISEKLSPALTSFNIECEPAPPFLVLEYISKSNKRKDYKDSFRKYERELRIPYYLVFDSDEQALRLYHQGGRGYEEVVPNEQGRLALPELELEVGVLDSWVRFWFRGELLPLPADLQREVDELRTELKQAKQQARREKQRAEQEKQRAEQEKQRAEQEKQARAAAEAELERLRALVARLHQAKPAPGAERRRR